RDWQLTATPSGLAVAPARGPVASAMFGLFKSPSFRDPRLGDLVRSRGHWRGSLVLADGTGVPLALAGTRAEPDAQAVAAAAALPAQLASLRPTIETALFEHYAPYAEAVGMGDLSPSGEAFPRINEPRQVWPHVSLVFVAVTPFGWGAHHGTRLHHRLG
ncbi:MAG TPA: hypothetical protein VLI72_02260, partial [Methylibium sp.]|nr:hypothetical protein [Methylibium sp.]